MNKLYQKMALYGSMLATVGILGCEEANRKAKIELQKIEKQEQVIPYFSKVVDSTNRSRVLEIATGDFDNDNDLDLIVGVSDNSGHFGGNKLYFLENDGKGNFTLKGIKTKDIINIPY